MKRFALLAGLAVLALGAAACNSATPGSPSAQTQATQPAVTTPNGDGGGSGGGGNGLPVDRVCSLLSSADLSQLGASSAPTEGTIGTAHTCEFDNAEGHVIVGVRTNVGLDGFNASGGTVKDITVGRHQAKQDVDNTGSCIIAIGVTTSSRVDVTVTGDGTTDPCPTSMAVANIVEPKLP